MKVPILFERCFDKDTGARWGGDLNFCRKARAKGFRVYAIPEMELGHTAKTIVKDTLGAALRRQAGTTLRHICGEIREGRETIAMVSEAIRYVDNTWGAREDLLLPAIVKARNATGPIIETGTGLSTVLMAAANPDQIVYCLEHDKRYADELRRLAGEAGVGNIGLCLAPIVNGWYDKDELKDLPDWFALGVNDGPPRTLGSRMGFYDYFSGKCDVIIADDIEDADYCKQVKEFANVNGYGVDIIEPRTAILTSFVTYKKVVNA